jgi:hypothetical protein
MTQENPPGSGSGSSPAERRGTRAEMAIPASLRERAVVVATVYDTSLSEVLIRCLAFGLADDFVLSFIDRAADRRRRLGRIAVGDDVQTQVRLPASTKDRLRAVAQQFRVDEKAVVLRCLQIALFDEAFLQMLAAKVSGAKKRGRTRGQVARKEETNPAA